MASVPYILWLDDPAASGHPALGGKFSSLARSVAAGFSVPPGFGITTSAYRDFMVSAGLVAEADRVRAAASTIALADIRGETAGLLRGILTAPLPAQLEDEVRGGYARLERRTGISAVPVAVRSSGESEDLAGASFAGQYDTFLWISGADALLTHMRRCWAGMFGEAVLSYSQNGEKVISKGDFGICVGIQQMVQPRAAGVMFTLDPITGDRSKIVLEACWGLGEGVVKGDITPSQFTVDKVTREILKRKVSVQTEEYRFDASAGGVGLNPVEPERQEKVCLSDTNIVELAALAKRVEKERGAPQDIEWAVDAGDNLWVLQVRPETVWSHKAAKPIIQGKSPIDHVLSRMSGVKPGVSAKNASQS